MLAFFRVVAVTWVAFLWVSSKACFQLMIEIEVNMVIHIGIDVVKLAVLRVPGGKLIHVAAKF